MTTEGNSDNEQQMQEPDKQRKRDEDRRSSESERRRWVIRATALVSALIFLLVALLMIGIPYLNAHLIEGAAFNSQDLASWQITALISLVGMLIGGVFIITAFKVDSTAKYTAFTEARDTAEGVAEGVAKRELEQSTDSLKKKIKKELKKEKADLEALNERLKKEKVRLKNCVAEAENSIAQSTKRVDEVANSGRSAIEEMQNQGSSAIADLGNKAEKELSEAVEKGRSAVQKAVQDMEARTTSAIDTETTRFRQAGDALLTELQHNFSERIEQIEGSAQDARKFFDEVVPDLVRNGFDPDQIEAIRERVAEKLSDKLSDELLAEQVSKAVQNIFDEQPERFADPLVEKVVDQIAKMARWRWMFRGKGRSSS